MKIENLINDANLILKEKNIEDYSIISKILICYVFDIDRNNLILNMDREVNEEEKRNYLKAINKVIEGVPIQYVTNKQEFMGIPFYIDENVLVPQPDTEILVEEVLNICKKSKESFKILDLCTGSGAIGISIAKNLSNAEITLSDISSLALKVAKKNIKINNLEQNVKIVNSDMFENIKEKYNIIVSNPPYIETDVIKTLSKSVQKEPFIALNGGSDGLYFYRILANNAKKYLIDNGYLCMEIGYNQKNKVEELLKESGYKNVYTKKDLAGNDRIVIANI